MIEQILLSRRIVHALEVRLKRGCAQLCKRPFGMNRCPPFTDGLSSSGIFNHLSVVHPYAGCTPLQSATQLNGFGQEEPDTAGAGTGTCKKNVTGSGFC